MTKFFGGHSDLVAGCIMGDAATMATIRGYRTILGSIPSPQTCWLLSRSLETLELRMRRQCESAARVVAFLEQQLQREGGQVKALHYPGLLREGRAGGGSNADAKSNSNSNGDRGDLCDDVFAEEFEGPGSLIAFELVGGKAQAFRLLNAVKVWVSQSLFDRPLTCTLEISF